jgi:hypothetical protein
LVERDPQYGIHRLVKQIKDRSSRLLREEFASLKRRLPTLWTNSYFVATVGGAPSSPRLKPGVSRAVFDERGGCYAHAEPVFTGDCRTALLALADDYDRRIGLAA